MVDELSFIFTIIICFSILHIIRKYGSSTMEKLNNLIDEFFKRTK